MLVKIEKSRWLPKGGGAAHLGVTIYRLWLCGNSANNYTSVCVGEIKTLLAFLGDRSMEKVDLTFPGSMAETVAYRRNGWIRILSPIGTLSFPEESANSWAGDIEQAMQSPLYRIGLLAEAKARSTIQGILARKRHRKTVLRNYLNKVNSKA